MDLRVSIDNSDVARIEAIIGGGPRGPAARAIQAAVSRTITTGRARIARRIGEEVRLPIGKIKDSVIVSNASYDKPFGTININRGKGSWLVDFLSAGQKRTALKKVAGNLYKQVQPKSGLAVKVRKKPTPQYPGVERLPHAFLAVAPKSNYLGIFERTGVKKVAQFGRYKGKLREVIRRKRGPSPLGVFINAKGEGQAKTILDETVADLGTVLEKNIQSQIQRFLAGKGN